MLIAPQNLQALAEVATDGILNSLLAGLAIALLAWTVTEMFGRRGSGTRFAVWFSALVAIAILPWFYHVGAGHALSSASRSAVALPASVASYLFLTWIIGTTFGLLRVGISLYRLQHLRSTCAPIDLGQLEPRLRECIAEAQAHRRITLCCSDAVRVPAAVGYFRPIVVFPAWALQEIPATELEAILRHELAHLRRWDDWTNLAQKIVKAVFFFHPAVWFIESRLSLEREMACDDAVLAANFSPRAYAESLIGLAEKSFLRRGVQLAQAAVGHVRQLKLRLSEILRKDRGQQGSARPRKAAIALISLAAIVSVYGISRAPRLVAFSSDAPQLASASTVSHALSRTNDFHLQPVNLSYTDRRQPASAPAGRVQRTQLRVTHRAATKPQLVLVVFQGEQFGPNGPVFWRVTVLHLTPAQQRVITGGISKKI